MRSTRHDPLGQCPVFKASFVVMGKEKTVAVKGFPVAADNLEEFYNEVSIQRYNRSGLLFCFLFVLEKWKHLFLRALVDKCAANGAIRVS